MVCRFSRLINTGDTSNDYNLANSLFQLYGTSSNGGKYSNVYFVVSTCILILASKDQLYSKQLKNEKYLHIKFLVQI